MDYQVTVYGRTCTPECRADPAAVAPETADCDRDCGTDCRRFAAAAAELEVAVAKVPAGEPPPPAAAGDNC